MAGEKHRVKSTALQLLFQSRQRFHRQLVILCQSGDKAVSTVRTEPDGVTGEQVFVINKIDHMPPGVAGDEKALDLDPVDVQNLPLCK